MDLVCPATKVSKVGSSLWDIETSCELERFAVVKTPERVSGGLQGSGHLLKSSQLVCVLLHQIGKAGKKAAALGTVNRGAPTIVVCIAGSTHSSVDVVGGALADLCDDLGSGWVDNVNRLAGGSGGEFVVDEDSGGEVDLALEI